MSLSERIKLAMDQAGLSQTGLARACGIKPPSVHGWLSGKAKFLRGENLLRAASALGVRQEWLASGVGPMRGSEMPASLASVALSGDGELEDAPPIRRKPQLIPVVGRVQAGDDGLLHIDDVDHVEGYLSWYANCPEAYALRIRGESMSPRYLPGEFVGVDPCAEVLPSDEVIVSLKDGRRMIKRLLWSRDDQACFESVNKNYPNIVLDCQEIERLHLVLGHIPKSAFKPNI